MNLQERLDYVRGFYASDIEGKRRKPSFKAWLRGKGYQWWSNRMWHDLDPKDCKVPDFRMDCGIDSNPRTDRDRHWSPGDRILTGSGRNADWCHISYLQYVHICQCLRESFGWSGDDIRRTARSLNQIGNYSSYEWKAPDLDFPAEHLGALEGLSGHPLPSGGDDRKAPWLRWLACVFQPSWGRWKLDHYVRRLQKDPEAKTPSDIVGEIRRLRGVKDPSDLRGCSGCEHLRVLAERPDLHELFLSRAPEAERTTYDGRPAVIVPFGLPYPPEFDRCAVLSLSAEIRVRSSDGPFSVANTPDAR